MKRLPNILSLIRLIGSLSCLYFATIFDNVIIFILFAFLGLTDLLDGFLARKFKCESNLGDFLDKVADRSMLYVMSLIVGLNIYLFLFIVLKDYIYSCGRELLLKTKSININQINIDSDKLISLFLFLYLLLKLFQIESSFITMYLVCAIVNFSYYLFSYFKNETNS